MAEKINATCSICGKGYYKCLTCQSDIKTTPWRQHTDTSEHYKIFQVIHGYNTCVYTKFEAKNKLQSIDLSDLDELRDNIKKIIKDIMKEDKKVEKYVETIEESVVETVVSERAYAGRKKKNFEPASVEADSEVE